MYRPIYFDRGPHIAFATNEWAYRYMTFTAWLLLRKRTG